jgi:hypothetical protein
MTLFRIGTIKREVPTHKGGTDVVFETWDRIGNDAIPIWMKKKKNM